LQHIAEKIHPLFHGIGHFLGLEVHDVGDLSSPLEEGDIITLEPGIYLPEENIGVRIEDDFVVEKDGVRPLSAALAKMPIIW
jgi:Xaa-Pro aminopeptidase